MKKLVIGVMLMVVPLMVVPLVASATDWYIFDGQNQKCISSARASAESGAPMTPLPWRNFFLSHPSTGYTGYKVYYRKGGRAVALFFDGGKQDLMFFSNKVVCQNFRESLTNSGQGLNQLK